jgi:hypothetical protein
MASNAQWHFDLDRHRVGCLTIDVVGNKSFLGVVYDCQMGPALHSLSGENSKGVVVPISLAGRTADAEDQFAALADLPVDTAFVPTVGHHQGVVAVGQGIHADPCHERN